MEQYTVIHKQRKTLTMRLDSEGKVTVLAPLRFPQSEIEKFVHKQTGWLERKKRELSARRPLPKLTMTEGEAIPLFGNEYVLRFWDKRSVAVEENTIFLPRNNPKTALIRYYGNQLKEYVAPVLARYSRLMNVEPSKVSVSSARTRWGSCSGKNAITFSFRLAMCDGSAVEYVAVHELCHVLHKNHSKAFWDEVAKYYPAYKQARTYLKEKAYFMEII